MSVCLVVFFHSSLIFTAGKDEGGRLKSVSLRAESSQTSGDLISSVIGNAHINTSQASDHMRAAISASLWISKPNQWLTLPSLLLMG